MVAKKKYKSITFVSPLGLPILLDPPESGAGGAERQFFFFGRGLLKKGWSVCYITNDASINRARKTVMPVQTASFSFMGGNKRRILLDWMSLLYAMWRTDSCFYVVKTPAYLLIPMCIFTKIFRRKLVFWAQTEFDAYPERRPKGRLLGFLLDRGINRADIIIAQSNIQVAGFEKNFSKQAKLVKSISGSLSGETGSDKRSKRVDILWVGNSMENKRYEIVLSLAKMLPEYTFAVAMNKADPARYAQAGEKSRLIDNVDFLGEVNPVEMESWFSSARLLLNTSAREGFPNTYIQAWQHGVPVVSLCIDPDDVVAEHGLGIVIDKGLTEILKGDEGRYAEMLLPSMNKILTDNDFYKSLSVNAIDYIARNHSESILVGRLESILLDS